MHDKLTRDRLCELLRYEDGQFFWAKTVGGRAPAGEQAGCLMGCGHRSIRIDGILYFEHRLVWLWHHGKFPDGDLDHKDGNGLNNRISNLRPTTASQNVANSRISAANKSGYKGVSWKKELRKWKASIMVSRVHRHLGYFTKIEDAADAYSAAATASFGEFANPAQKDIQA